MAELDTFDTTEAKGDSDDPSGIIVVNELLCFMQEKGDIMTADDIVKICCDFYSREDIEKARTTLLQYVNQRRLPKQKGGSERDTNTRTVTIMLKICLDPAVTLPQFCARKPSRLPPVDVDHVDVSALLLELSALRREVRAVAQLREEVTQLKDALHVSTHHHHHDRERQIQPPNVDNDGASEMVNSAVKTFAGLAKEIVNSTGPVFQAKEKKPAKKPVFGVSTQNQHVKSVSTTRCVDIFVSRLHPETSTKELEDCVETVKKDIAVVDVTCVKLKSRYESLYSSFHVSVRVDTKDMKPAIDTFMSGESLPMGVFVKRYFRTKDGTSQ